MAIIDNNLKVHTCLEFYTKLGMIHISYQKYHSNQTVLYKYIELLTLI